MGMNEDSDLLYSPIVAEDVDSLTGIMTRAFDEDARIHCGEGHRDGPPGYDNGDFLRKWALEAASEAYKVSLDKELIGVYIVFLQKDGNNHLGCLFIDSSAQNKGIGLQIWKHIENSYPDTQQWHTETPGSSKRNHHFYINKCGFQLVKVQNSGDIETETYILQKDMSGVNFG